MIGFTMATLFAALLMERKIVGTFADWLSDAFAEIHARLSNTFPLPRRSSISAMYRYSMQSLGISSGVVLLVVPVHLVLSLNVWIAVFIIFVVGLVPLLALYRHTCAEEAYDFNLFTGARLFAACLLHEIVMLLISPFALIAVFLLEIMRSLFGFLSYHDDAKKLLVIIGTLVAFAGLIVQFAASFRV